MLQRTDQQAAREHQRQAERERKRRYRERLKNGGAVLRVEVRDLNALIGSLLSLRWLDETKSEDRKQIAAAVGHLLDATFANLSRVDRQ